MPRRLLLLADDTCLSQLRSAGISDRLLVDGETLDSERADRPQHDFIERRDPDIFLPNVGKIDGEESREIVERREDLFACLLGSVACHLVVLGNEPGGNNAGETSVLLSDDAPIDRLVEWYRVFEEEAARRVDYRRHDYRHLLILICSDDIPNKHLSQLQQLLERKDDGNVIQACYVMLRRLNWASSHVCHSRYVWPISVARLLHYLMLSDGGCGLHTADRPEVLAWRGIELVPRLPEPVIEEHFRNLWAGAYHALFQPEQDQQTPTWDKGAFNPEPYVKKGKLKKRGWQSPSDWQKFGARRAWEDATDMEHWVEKLEEHGEKVAGENTRGLLARTPEAWQQIHRVWSQVHIDSRFLAVALSQPDIVHGPDVARELERLLKDFECLDEIVRQRETALQEADRCATYLEEAQRGFLGPGRRMILACFAAGFVIYASMILMLSLLGSWGAALTVSTFGAAGAVLAACLPHLWESFAGKRATSSFCEDVLTELDQRMIDRDFACQELVANGHRFWAKSRAASASRRLRELLRRFDAMIQQEMGAGNTAGEPQGNRFDEFRKTGPREERRRRRQRDEFLRSTRVEHEFQAFRPEEDALEKERDHCVEQFRQTWQALCRKYDRNAAGNMPAHVWIPELRAFHEGFQLAINDELCRQAIGQMGEDHNQQWSAELRSFLNQSYDYYMSCPITSSESSEDRRMMRLFLQKGMEGEGFGQDPERLTVDYVDLMDDLPMFGLLFDETPVTLGEGPDGNIEAVVYDT